MRKEGRGPLGVYFPLEVDRGEGENTRGKVHLRGSLGLYDAHEMHMVLWYMDFLYGVRLYELGELQVRDENKGYEYQ